MAKAKPAPAQEATATAPGPIKIPVSWGDLSIGETTCRIGARATRGGLMLAQADRTLCGKRLTADIIARRSGGPDQASIPGFEEEDFKVSAVFDVKSIGVNPKRITFGLTFSIESVDLEALAHFPKRDGRIEIHGTEAIPEGAGKGDDSDED